ncbi:MAG TPA: hypothetical protein VFP21_12010 [Solirubrobacterales bacterium]|nr:hypothetical protein [Solirubrobacterales bacterium]
MIGRIVAVDHPGLAGRVGIGVADDDGRVAPKRTDLGNAERLADHANGKLLWVYGQGWLHWDGKRWKRDESNQVMRIAADTARRIDGYRIELIGT